MRRFAPFLALLVLPACEGAVDSAPLEGTYHLTTMNGIGAPLIRGEDVSPSGRFTDLVEYDTLEFRSGTTMYRSTAFVQTADYPNDPVPVTTRTAIRTEGRFTRRGDRLLVDWDIPTNRLGAADTVWVRDGRLVRSDWYAGPCASQCGPRLRKVQFVYEP